MTLIDSWDSGQPGALWDSGLQWDINIPPNTGDVQPYLNLVTSKHNQQPRFMATLAAVLQMIVNVEAVALELPGLFDIDTAVGAQLDAVGQWIGRSRNVAVALTGVYFSLDSATLGLDQGSMQGPFDPVTGLVQLPDDEYRAVLMTQIKLNQWDGTIPGIYSAMDGFLDDSQVLVFDEENGHMALALTAVPDVPVYAQLWTQGYLTARPAGVQMDGFYLPVAPGVPYFCLDVDDANMSGLDVGAFPA